jgi:Ornithine cyclodeaminase/mu-crystallin family
MREAGRRQSKAAFETKKGARQVMTLSEAEVEKYLDPRELLDGLEDGFRGLELGEVQIPPRPKVTVPGKGFSLAMSAWRPAMQLTVKIVNVFDGNLNIDLPNHLALIKLSLGGTSRVTGDGQARICEGLGVKFPGLLGAISDGRPYRDSNPLGRETHGNPTIHSKGSER